MTAESGIVNMELDPVNVHYLISVNSYGDIRTVAVPKGVGNVADQSVDPVTGFTVIHYLNPIADINNFVETKFWSFSANAWMTRDPRPNKHAEWEGYWAFDSSLLLEDIRTLRNLKLAKSDWTQMSDSPLTAAQQTEAQAYRVLLRDFPSTLDMTTISSVEDVTWPTPPDFL